MITIPVIERLTIQRPKPYWTSDSSRMSERRCCINESEHFSDLLVDSILLTMKKQTRWNQSKEPTEAELEHPAKDLLRLSVSLCFIGTPGYKDDFKTFANTEYGKISSSLRQTRRKNLQQMHLPSRSAKFIACAKSVRQTAFKFVNPERTTSDQLHNARDICKSCCDRCSKTELVLSGKRNRINLMEFLLFHRHTT